MSEDYSKYDDISFEELKQLIRDNIFQKKSDTFNNGLWDYLRSEENIEDTRDALAEVHSDVQKLIYHKNKKGEDTKGTRIFIQEVQNRQTGTNKVIGKRKHAADRQRLVDHIAYLEAALDKAGAEYYPWGEERSNDG